ncbi:hypothetical protein SAMN05216569_1065 [Pseudoxanthomonas sp. CF125]|nr:hypothetical protein SAMN05216569_1065 [Pseudoxanthomonas sp. CF125]
MPSVLIRLERVFLPVASDSERWALYDWGAAETAHPHFWSDTGEAHQANGVAASL